MPKEYIQTERIDGDNQVVIGWSKGQSMVQIGVQERDATPGEREGGHFTTLSREQIRQIIATLQRAERQAYGPRHTSGCVNGSICGEPSHCPPD